MHSYPDRQPLVGYYDILSSTLQRMRHPTENFLCRYVLAHVFLRAGASVATRLDGLDAVVANGVTRNSITKRRMWLMPD